MKKPAANRRQDFHGQPQNLAIGYARVSTTDQAEEGSSLAAQVASIQRYATTMSLSLAPVASAEKWPVHYPPEGVFVDGGVSGSMPIVARPEGSKVVTLVRGRFVSHVIVTKQDRFSRLAMDIALMRSELLEYGVTLHLVDEGGAVGTGPSDRLLLGIRGELAQWQREVIGASTQSVLDHKRIKGEKLGGMVPFGKSVYLNEAGVKCLKDCPKEQAIIRRAVELRASGLSFRRIGEQLFKEGLRPRGGGPWSHRSISNMVGEE